MGTNLSTGAKQYSNDITGRIETLQNMTMASETEVGTKIAVPILEWLGYPPENRAEEFYVHMDYGREKTKKRADIILFSSSEYDNHKADTSSDREWVQNHALMVVELKKLDEPIDVVLGQAISYALWTKALYYIVTNGNIISVFALKEGAADTCILSCSIRELVANWAVLENHVSFNELRIKKLNLVDSNLGVTRIYENYCMSVLSTSAPEHTWRINQSFVAGNTINENVRSQTFNLDDILNTSKRSVIVAPTGYGKSYCLYSVADKLSKEYLWSNGAIVPIVLRCSLWKRAYNTLAEGIFAELRYLVPSITLASIQSEFASNRFFLLFDGLDECKVDRDLLLKEINDLANGSDAGVFVTSRRDKSIVLPTTVFAMYELEGLSESQIDEVAHEELGYKAWILNGTSTTLRKLLCAPMFLSMYLLFIKNEQTRGSKPKNLSAIYDYYIKNLLDANSSCKSPAISLRKILALLASELRKKTTGDLNISELISNIIPNTDASCVFNELIFSKIIYQYEGVVSFQFEAVREYFHSLYLSDGEEEQIYNYIDELGKAKKSVDTLMLMFGNIKNVDYQNKLLDYLERNNFFLYVKCLYSRHSFSSEYTDNMTEELCNKFFHQLIVSYENIVRTHFHNMMRNFYPWVGLEEGVDLNNIVTTVSGSINLKTLNISICIDKAEGAEGFARANIDFVDSAFPTMTRIGDENNIAIPMLSFNDGQRYFSYNLEHYFNGIDCAREIAVKIIYEMLKRVLKSDSLLLSEHPFAQSEYVERCLKLLPSMETKKALNTDISDISLRAIQLSELKSLFRPAINLEYSRNRGYYDERISFLILYVLMDNISKNDIDPLFALPPEGDYSSLPKETNSCYIWEVHRMSQLKEWIARRHDVYQICYRHLVENLFPTLKDNFQLYHSGPIQFQITVYTDDEDDQFCSEDCSVNIAWEAKRTMTDCKTIVKSVKKAMRKKSNYDDFNEKYDFAIKSLRFYGRGGYGIGISSTALSMFIQGVDGEDCIRINVRNKVLDELRYVFNEHQ